MKRWMLILCLCLASSGCGIKLMYNNLDRMLLWNLDDYVELNDEQMAYLRAELDVVLYWHRITQLPQYADMLRSVDVAVALGLTREHIAVFEERMLGYGEDMLGEMVPMMAEVLYDLSPDQAQEMARRSAKVNRKYLTEVEGLTLEERQKRWAKDFRDGYGMFVGKVSKEQRAIIAAQQVRYRPEEEVWVRYRRRWQANLQEMLKKRSSFPEFELRFRELAMNREARYGPEYEAVFKHNEQLYRDLSLDLAAAMTPKQHETLTTKLNEWAEALEELSVEGDPPKIPAPCLSSCGDVEVSPAAPLL